MAENTETLWSPNAPRCTAKSKRSQKTCRNPALVGATKCRMHNGKAELQPSVALTHGLTSAFIRVSAVPGLMERIAELKTLEGKEKALLTGAAVTEHRLEKLPDDIEFIEKFVAARKSIREDLKTSHEITKTEAPQASHTFVIATGNAQAERFEARSPEGHCTIHMVSGAPYMLDESTGALWPCQLARDEETGAELYRRMLAG